MVKGRRVPDSTYLVKKIINMDKIKINSVLCSEEIETNSVLQIQCFVVTSFWRSLSSKLVEIRHLI